MLQNLMNMNEKKILKQDLIFFKIIKYILYMKSK